ncbi:MAG TPA: type II secretion system F family protein [Crenalkalicoccus sp.]|nr:type II secretion system F family protein [Crenalkalicoccus sp.]
MARFRYRAVGPAGEALTGVAEAADRGAVLDQLRAAGLLPVEAEEGDAPPRPWWKREIRLSLGSPSGAGLAYAVQELGVLLDAGLTLDRSLAILAGQGEHKALRPVLEAVLDRVRGGTPLSTAMRDHPKAFPPVAVALAEAGEASGQLQAALARLGDMLLRAEQLKDQIRSALIYPALLVVAAAGSVLLLLTVVIPQFESFFEGSRIALPLATRLVMGASRTVREDGLLLILLLLGAGFLLRKALRGAGRRRRLDGLALRLPLLGPLLARIETARFARTLGTLIENGVPLPTGLAIAGRTFGNSAMAEAVETVAQSLKEGEGLAGPLEATGLMPPIAITFLRTGEETARLGEMLTRLADALDREIQKTSQRLLALLVPVITILLGVVVATIVGAILTAMLSLNELAN